MRAVEFNFVDFLDGQKQFNIPIFQRDFCWSRDRWSDLWNDINEVSKESEKDSHFLGSITYSVTNQFAGFNNWYVFDGQQRLTEITILFCALREQLKSRGPAGSNNCDGLEIDYELIENRFILNNPRNTNENCFSNEVMMKS